MLVLVRKPGESLLIGEDIELKIVDVSGDQVRIGIQAPREVTIVRKELLMVKKANEEAAAHQPVDKEKLLSFMAGFRADKEKQ